MAGEPLANWEDRVRTIASNLLTLEVNTVLKNGMVAQKMPEVPVALHAIVRDYAGYIAQRHQPLSRRLLAVAAARLSDKARSNACLQAMQSWAESGGGGELNWPLEGNGPPMEQHSGELTNGAESFEALAWAAIAARHAALDSEADPAAQLVKQGEAALFTRIEENSRQLREIAIVLEKAFSSFDPARDRVAPDRDPEDDAAKEKRLKDSQDSIQPYIDRLQAIVASEAPTTGSRLFGGTLDQTTQALFRYPRPVLSIEPDLTVLVRKAWDIGLEEVLFQTVIQVDGDVVVRVAELPDAESRAFMAALHRTAVDDGLKQWRLLFKVVGDLVSGIGEWLFGTRGRGAPAKPGTG